MTEPMTPPAWLTDLVAAIDARDAARFAQFIADDGVFVFGNQPPVAGRAAIREAVGGFFAALRALAHRLEGCWRDGDAVICTGRVTYTRHDGSQLTVPFCNLFRMRGPLITHYQIYCDNSELFRPA